MHKFYLSILLFSFICNSAFAQCSGNLGENIFLDGDFGSGQDNIYQFDLGIAPGYGYSKFPPPQDGNYTITNNTTTWPSFAANWVNIGDNSPDPIGYMMVVNASYEPGLFYEQEVTGLCPNTSFEFSADIHNLIIGNGDILPNVTFLLDGAVVFETGNVPGNGVWNTYGFTFTTGPNQTSVTLALQNNAPGGAGNDLAIDNISFRPCGPNAEILPNEIENICEDGDPIAINAVLDSPLQWQQSFDMGLTWQNIEGEADKTFIHTEVSAGDYYYRFVTANTNANLGNEKCRINSNIKIIRVQPKFFNITDTICDGLSVQVGNTTYSTSGTFTENLVSSIGCDSIVTLNLTIVPDNMLAAEFTISDPSCDYLSDGSFELVNISNGYPPYQVTQDGLPVDNGTLTNLAAGEFELLVTDYYGCILVESIVLENPQPFVIDIGSDLEVDLGDVVTITPLVSEPVNSVTIFPEGIGKCDENCENIKLQPTESGSIIAVAISTEQNCRAEASINITVNNTYKIYFPNAFSPNEDGVNDRFVISGSQPNVQSILLFDIFDRYGSLVYTKKDFEPNTELWTGDFDGLTVANGVYTYRAVVKFLDGNEVDYFGNITVLR